MAMFISEKGKAMFQRFQALERLAFEVRNEAREVWLNPANEAEKQQALNIRNVCGNALKNLINSEL